MYLDNLCMDRENLHMDLDNLYMDPKSHIWGVSGGGLRPPHPPLAPPARVVPKIENKGAHLCILQHKVSKPKVVMEKARCGAGDMT